MTSAIPDSSPPLVAEPVRHGPLAGPSALYRNWQWVMVRGVLALALGIIALLFPLNALFAFTLVFAAFSGADGIVSLIAGLRGAASHRERWWTLVLRGLVGIAIALLFLAMPGAATLGYALVTVAIFIAWAIIGGVLEIAAAVRLRKEMEGEWLLALSGVLSLLLGLFVWGSIWMNSLVSLITVAWIIGAWALIAGVALIALALRLKKRQQA